MEKEVKCRSINCIYNKSGYCNRKMITITGNNVDCNTDTKCELFENGGNIPNLTSQLKQNHKPKVGVCCDVSNCVFYLSGECNRVRISVGANKEQSYCESCKLF